MLGIRKRWSFTEVKEFIEELSNSGYKLLSETYGGSKKKIAIQCSSNHIYETLFDNFKKGHRCPRCSGLATWSFDEVKRYIEGFGYHLVNDEYKNTITEIEIKCPIGHIYTGTFKRFKLGRRCPFCNGGLKKDGTIVYNEFINKGVIPKFDVNDYQNNHQRLFFLCPKHHEKGTQSITYNNSQRCPHICHFCNIENGRSGEKHHAWKGGISKISDYLRNGLDEWKKESFAKCDYQCDITKTKKDLIIHHLYRNFSEIVQETFEVTGIEIKEKLIDYSKREIDALTETCQKLHYKYGLGVCLNDSVHKMFHKKYGIKNNTVNQYLDFKHNYSRKEGVIVE